MQDDTEWVMVARFDDPVAADVATNFLRDHGVTVALRGNSGSTSVLNRFDTVMDIRLVVPDYEERTAREVLAAMDVANADGAAGAADGTGDESSGGPYRALPVRGDGAPSVRKRMVLAPLVMAAVIPGGGHFYARHMRTGAVLCAGVVLGFLVGIARGRSEPVLAAQLIMAADALLGAFAVRRCNEGRVTSPGTQTSVGLAIVILAVAVAASLGRRA